MDLLIPQDEASDALLDADRGAVPELSFGAAQIGCGEAYVSRLSGTSLDPDVPLEGPADQLDQPVEPHPRAAADVDRLRDAARPGPRGPRKRRQDPVHAVRNIGVVALARPVA